MGIVQRGNPTGQVSESETSTQPTFRGDDTPFFHLREPWSMHRFAKCGNPWCTTCRLPQKEFLFATAPCIFSIHIFSCVSIQCMYDEGGAVKKESNQGKGKR